MGMCQTDLADNGIDLARTDEDGLRRIVGRHLDYFQMMLGYDARPAEVLTLCKRLRDRLATPGRP